MLTNDCLFNNKVDLKETSIGYCNNINHPQSNIKLNSIDINCKQAEGCLFCEHFRCHADSIDVNKLYSLLYIINECKYIAKNEDHFNSIYGSVIKRINNIFLEIRDKNYMSQEDISKIKSEVFENENLHPYWEHKLSTLCNMGVLK